MIVIKLGGTKGIEDKYILDDIQTLVNQGKKLILVHGGSEETNLLAEKLGHPPRFVTSISGFESRYTDRETMEIFAMAYCGKRNKILVEGLQQRGVNAVGISGIDGRLVEGPLKSTLKIIENGKKKVLNGDNTGKITAVNAHILDVIMSGGFLPVVCPPGISESESRMMNIDGDRMAAALAAHYHADALVILSRLSGLLKDITKNPEEENNLIRTVDLGTIDNPYAFAKDRMKKKIMGAIEAITSGVKRVILASANVENPILRALGGEGTHIFNSCRENEENREWTLIYAKDLTRMNANERE